MEFCTPDRNSCILHIHAYAFSVFVCDRARRALKPIYSIPNKPKQTLCNAYVILAAIKSEI